MEAQELHEHAEHAHHSGEKALGLTTAIVAVLLSLATLLSLRSQTEEMLTLTQNVDDWNFYQAKHDRAYMFGLTAEIEALIPNGKDSARKNFLNSIEEECGLPPVKGCTSPVLRKSPVLQAFVKENNLDAGTKPAAKESATARDAAAAETAAAEKNDKPTQTAPPKDFAIEIQERATERQREVNRIEARVDRYETSELFLEISIVLCSVALLAENRIYWKLSFVSTTVGVALAVWGLLLR